MTTFHIHALPAEVITAVRTSRIDATGRPAEPVTAAGGEPVRCCLSNATPGQPLLLFNYAPPLPDSPYRETGAVYVHADPCVQAPSSTEYPRDWHGRPQVLRAYDDRGWIHDATTVHDGTDPERAIAEVLARPGVMQVHSRNVSYGCYMFAVTRD